MRWILLFMRMFGHHLAVVRRESTLIKAFNSFILRNRFLQFDIFNGILKTIFEVLLIQPGDYIALPTIIIFRFWLINNTEYFFIELKIKDVIVVILQGKVPFLHYFYFLFLIEWVKLFIKVGEFVIIDDRLHSHLFNIVLYVWIYTFIALEYVLNVTFQVISLCVSIGQINDDFVRRSHLQLFLAAIVVAY